MYKIEKYPTPVGMASLNSPITVNEVTGADNIYDNDGELRASVKIDPSDNKIHIYKVTYKRIYDDGTERDFVTKERLTASQNTFSLSKAPMFPKNGSIIKFMNVFIEEENN